MHSINIPEGLTIRRQYLKCSLNVYEYNRWFSPLVLQIRVEEVIQQLDRPDNLGSRIVYKAQIIIPWASAIYTLSITSCNSQIPGMPSFEEDPKLMRHLKNNNLSQVKIECKSNQA